MLRGRQAHKKPHPLTFPCIIQLKAANNEIKALKALLGESKPQPQQPESLQELQHKLDAALLSEKRMRDKLALAEARADAGAVSVWQLTTRGVDKQACACSGGPGF